MKSALFGFVGMALIATSSGARAADATFTDVWSQVQSGPYAGLPEYHTARSHFIVDSINYLAQSADRTLSDDSDVLPRFQKLVHPIGICFAGTWHIDADSPYTGYFAKDSTGLIIVRASEALGNPESGGYRSFGFAGKIFPTTDRNAALATPTANFFTVDDLGGTLADSFLDQPKLNAPKTSLHPSTLAIFPTLLAIAKTFSHADSKPNVRQVYPISELGLTDPSSARTPQWMMITSETTQRVAASDFRDELRLANYPGGLHFGILVSDDKNDGWQRLGSITLTEEALSDGCDHRLHFHHPRWANIQPGK